MDGQSGASGDSPGRKEPPIERGFPIERVNTIAEKEARGIAKRYYRPIYTMHKWWARRLGCTFRTISLYSLLDDASGVEVYEPGEDRTLDDFDGNYEGLSDLIDSVSISNPDSLWELYNQDVRIPDKKVLDPFVGGGTSIVEASRFGAEVVGHDLNPVAWFVSKKELDAGQADLSGIEEAYEYVQNSVEDEIKKYFKTECPNGDHKAEVICFFWVKKLDCTSCGDSVRLFNDYRVAKGRYDDHKGQQIVVCPDCGSFEYVDDWQSDCTCSECGNEYDPSSGTGASGGSKYACPSCGQIYPVTDAIGEQDGFDLELYGLEYFCEECEKRSDFGREDYKGYKPTTRFDQDLFEEAKEEWNNSPELKEYVPSEELRPGHMISDRNPVFDHGYSTWADMFSDRQLLSLSKLLKSIDQIENQDHKEFLLLSFSDALRGSNMMVTYQTGANAIDHIFKSNSFDPPKRPAENNPLGAKEGSRDFRRAFDRLKKGIEYGSAPFDRYPDSDGEMVKSASFSQPVGSNAAVYQGDSKDLDYEDEFDAVITDPPYYDNIIYSELSDFFYVWQKIVLNSEYDAFKGSSTPREDSIVANPFENKGEEEFEEELREVFENLINALKQDGILVFTYHHSGSESWGQVLESLCDVGFEVTGAYPITADLDKLEKGESVSFDIIIVAKPSDEREPASWNTLRRKIYRTARETRSRLEADRDLSRGDIGVMEMGECFREYSKHHGKVQRDGEIMSAKEVVQEIYGIIQEASDIGVEDVFIDLLDTANVSYDDVNKLCRGTNATPEDLKETRLYNQDDGFELGTWDNEKRQAYIQERVNGDGGDHLSNLDKLQFLRYRYEKGQAVQNYVEKWDVDDDMRELAGRLADVTGDDTYTRVLGDRDITSY